MKNVNKITTQLFGGCAAAVGAFFALLAVYAFSITVNHPDRNILEVLWFLLSIGVIYAGIKIFRSAYRS